VNNAILINQSSGAVEWYTPSYIIEAARLTMGSIDLDPASCAKANETVKAFYYYTAENDALTMQWVASTLWLNHPFAKATNRLWINKLVSEYSLGNFEQACAICFASTSEVWFQPLYDFPICFISPRVNYIDADGKPVAGVTKGSCVTYLGTNVHRFIEVFSEFGRVMMPTYCKRK
jgi:DNA N-6-adenine-methyltransferase (Dam)